MSLQNLYSMYVSPLGRAVVLPLYNMKGMIALLRKILIVFDILLFVLLEIGFLIIGAGLLMTGTGNSDVFSWGLGGNREFLMLIGACMSLVLLWVVLTLRCFFKKITFGPVRFIAGGLNFLFALFWSVLFFMALGSRKGEFSEGLFFFSFFALFAANTYEVFEQKGEAEPNEENVEGESGPAMEEGEETPAETRGLRKDYK